MRKIITFIIIIIILSPLCAADFIQPSLSDKTPLDTIKKARPIVSSTLDLSSVSVENIGIYSKRNEHGEAAKLTKITFVKPEDNNGFFKTPEFFIYWNVITSADKLPQIILEIGGPLISNIGKDQMDWTLRWKRTKDASFTDAISSSSTNSKSSPIELVKITDPNQLVLTEDYIILQLETEEPYWEKPAAYYTATLWINIIHN